MITVERKFYIQQRAIGTRGNEGWYDIITRHECSSIGDALEYIKNNKEIYTTLTYLRISSVVFGTTCLIFVFSDIMTLLHLFS